MCPVTQLPKVALRSISKTTDPQSDGNRSVPMLPRNGDAIVPEISSSRSAEVDRGYWPSRSALGRITQAVDVLRFDAGPQARLSEFEGSPSWCRSVYGQRFHSS